jgi:hypothetical protein
MSKAKSGGGITSNKLVHRRHIGGQRHKNAVSPSAVDMMGQSTSFQKPDLIKGRVAHPPLGNDLATNVGKGGPGAGRTTYHCGTQGTQGKPSHGEGGMAGAADRGSRAILGPPNSKT